MADESNGLKDSVSVEVNPDNEDTPAGDNLPGLPDRPADSASVATWVDYCVALGADRAFITGESDHEDGEKLTRTQLGELADRLGG